MNWKNRLTNYNFWISMFSAVLLVLQALKIEFDIVYINEIFTAILGLLVVIGIISDPTRTTIKNVEISKKVETMDKVVEEKSTQKETEKIPNAEKDEVDNVITQNDFKTILNKISFDLNEKIESIKQSNKEILKNETGKNIENNQHLEVSQTAVAEMENPYIDLVN